MNAKFVYTIEFKHPVAEAIVMHIQVPCQVDPENERIFNIPFLDLTAYLEHSRTNHTIGNILGFLHIGDAFIPAHVPSFHPSYYGQSYLLDIMQYPEPDTEMVDTGVWQDERDEDVMIANMAKVRQMIDEMDEEEAGEEEHATWGSGHYEIACQSDFLKTPLVLPLDLSGPMWGDFIGKHTSYIRTHPESVHTWTDGEHMYMSFPYRDAPDNAWVVWKFSTPYTPPWSQWFVSDQDGLHEVCPPNERVERTRNRNRITE